MLQLSWEGRVCGNSAYLSRIAQMWGFVHNFLKIIISPVSFDVLIHSEDTSVNYSVFNGQESY